MASETGWLGRANIGILPAVLFGLALFFSLIGFSAGWFSVDTKVQIWEYDETDPEGKGEPCLQLADGTPLCTVRIHTEMRMLELNTRITPDRIHDYVESVDAMPTYDEHMGRTGTTMIGILMLHVIAFVALAAAVGFYAWTRRSASRTFGPSVWRFCAIFGVFALITLLYLAMRVPAAAEGDTHDVLEEYAFLLETQGFPQLDPQMLQPEVKFWNTWTCCPPESNFPRNGNTYLVVVTTESRPSGGFWLEAANLVFATGALALATNAGQLDAKARPATPATPPPPMTKAE